MRRRSFLKGLGAALVLTNSIFRAPMEVVEDWPIQEYHLPAMTMEEMQLYKTTLLRQQLDYVYHQTNPGLVWQGPATMPVGEWNAKCLREIWRDDHG